MKPQKVKFIDASLERAWNNLNENDPTKKALIKAIKDIKEIVIVVEMLKRN